MNSLMNRLIAFPAGGASLKSRGSRRSGPAWPPRKRTPPRSRPILLPPPSSSSTPTWIHIVASSSPVSRGKQEDGGEDGAGEEEEEEGPSKAPWASMSSKKAWLMRRSATSMKLHRSDWCTTSVGYFFFVDVDVVVVVVVVKRDRREILTPMEGRTDGHSDRKRQPAECMHTEGRHGESDIERNRRNA